MTTTTTTNSWESLVERCNLIEDTKRDGRPLKRMFIGSHYHFAPEGKDWPFFDEMLQGIFYTSENILTKPDRWMYVGEWSDGYRGVWVNPTQRATFTYCEGDLILVVCGTPERFSEEMAESKNYYEGYLQ